MTFRHKQRISHDTWIVVADGARASIYSRPPVADAELVQIESLDFPDGAAHPHDLVSDRQGYFKGRDGSLEAGDPKTEFRQRTAQRFAREIVQYLEHGRQRQEFGHLILIAAPAFLGALRSQLSGPLSKLVTRTIDKDYTTYSADELAECLATTS